MGVAGAGRVQPSVPATRVGVHEAKTQLSRLLRLVDAGREVEIMRNGAPVARLVPGGSAGQRRSGTDRDRFTVPEDFDAPLPVAVLESFSR
jgi:prevent-host-death family protein